MVITMPLKNNSPEYWRNRMLLLEKAQQLKTERFIKDVERQYAYAARTIEDQILVWYARFAQNNQIDMATARQWLNTKELAEFKWDVKQYIKYGQENALDQRWMKELENASARVHISRLEALKLQMQQQVEALYGNKLDGVDNHLRRIYSDEYFHTAYEIQKGFNIGWDLHDIDSNRLTKILSRPWAADGKTFSSRIWTNKQQLYNTLQTQLSQAVITGKSPADAIQVLVDQFGVDKRKAGRLIMTETAAFASAAQKDCYSNLSVERFEIVATLDSSTSEICQELDGQVFDMQDYEVGVTAPPFHCWCRTVTVPFFDDNYGERAARGADGKTYYVPSDMKYEDWAKSFVGGGSKAGLSQIDRPGIIDNIMNSDAMSKFDDVHRALIKTDLENASDMNIRIVQQSIDKLHLDTAGTQGCFYRPGSGYLEMNMSKDPLDNVRTFWHEYGHYIDDVRHGNGLKLLSIAGDSNYSFEVMGVSSRADLVLKYDSRVGSDIQGFLDQMAPGKYDVRGDNYVNIYLKGTDIQIGEQWGANHKDFSALMDEINDGLKRKLGAYDSQEYLRKLARPMAPEWSKYWTQYRTPKRQLLRNKPAFKGAEEAWNTAMKNYVDAVGVWEKTNFNAYAEADKLYKDYMNRQARFAAVSDLLEGETRGEMGMRILWGGHDSTYFKINDKHVREGWANWFQLTFQNDIEMLNYLEEYAPEAKRIFEECYDELVKQTFGGG